MSEQSPHEFRGFVLSEQSDRERFSDASGILRSVPAAVAAPVDAADLQSALRLAASQGAGVIPRGAGTGMPGGNVGSGILLDLLPGFRGVGAVDAARMRIRTEPGVTLAAVNAATAPYNLYFPVDPSSGARCTLGGMIANNSAGAHSVRYGATRRWIHSLDVLLADGTPLRLTRGERPEHPKAQAIQSAIDGWLGAERATVIERWPRVRKNSSGYALDEYLKSGDLLDLVVGSEGTLALVVEAELKLARVSPARGVALLEFTTLEGAGAAVQELLPYEPATCEMLDRTFLELVRAGGRDSAYPLREGLEAILLVEVEGEDDLAVKDRLHAISRAVASLADRATTAVDPERHRQLWEIRHAASPLIAERADGRISMQFIEDGVVPVERLPEYVRALRGILGSRDIPAVIFGHAGDGNLHVNPLVDVSAPGWREEIEAVLYEIAGVISELGGTLSGEHGDGRLRAPLLDRVWGAPMVERFRRVKEAFDPTGMLNPGVILPLPGQRPLELLRDYPGAV